jgi:hypothetical protein
VTAPGALSRTGGAPYPVPPPGAPARVAFVGQRTYFEACSVHRELPGLLPAFVDFRGGANVGEMLGALTSFAPHVVVVFRPEILPPGIFAGLDAAVLGFTTEPLPRAGEPAHRLLVSNLAELDAADAGNFDRVICFDPHGWDAAAERLPAWRCMPLPVDDRLFAPVRPALRPPRALFIGFPTAHRRRYLEPVQEDFDIVHYAHGLMGEDLRAAMAATDIGINLHGARRPLSFENRVLLHLAAGHLLISEPLSPSFGLEPGLDFLEVADADEFRLRVHEAHATPEVHHLVRVRGRDKAEQFRASTVWPRVVRDLLEDLAAFGTAR